MSQPIGNSMMIANEITKILTKHGESGSEKGFDHGSIIDIISDIEPASKKTS